jgi:hypothetical protein
MPINNSLMAALEKRYGKRGRKVYFALENRNGRAFRKGLKTAAREGHTSKNLAAYRRRRGRKV